MSHRHPKVNKTIKIGTRGSPLALIQAREVSRLISKKGPLIEIKEVIIKTTGDSLPFVRGGLGWGRTLSTSSSSPLNIGGGEYSGKGFFIKEIEEALESGRIDIAVHSLKDVPSKLPKGLQITAYLERGNPHDLFVSLKYKKLKDMPSCAVIGTSSPRRMAQVLSARPDLKIIPLRGNVETRLKKIKDGVCDATILAAAGLKRLDLFNRQLKHLNTLASMTHVSEAGQAQTLKHFISAIGQGIICVETRIKDKELNEFIKASVNHHKTETAALAERSFLKAIGGDCHTPIAAHAKVKNDRVNLTGFVASPDGKKTIIKSLNGSDPIAVGKKLGQKFIKLNARKIIKRKTILVTGTNCDPSKFPGANVIHLPLIEIKNPSDNFKSMDNAIKRLNKYDWIVFTSQNAVEKFFERLKKKFSVPKIAAVGMATAEKIRSYGLNVDLVPSKEFSSASLAREFLKFDMKGKKVLFPRAKKGFDMLVKALEGRGANVFLVEAYQTTPAKIDIKKWKKRLSENPPDEIIFLSPSAKKVAAELALLKMY